MDTENPSAHAPSKSRKPGKNHPHAGVIHEHVRHTTQFTTIGNDLAQHRELSGLAIGLGVHIQSVPPGTCVDIKSLAKRFPEGATRLAAALRELEAHGYLRRERHRTADGRIVTRTISCNKPGHRPAPAEASAKPARRPTPTEASSKPARRPTPTEASDKPAPRPRHAQDKPPPRRKLLPAVPKPAYSSPELLRTAVDLLATLRRHDPRLLLSATDAEHLAPGVAAWLERDLTPTAVRHALIAGLPEEPLYRPAALQAGARLPGATCSGGVALSGVLGKAEQSAGGIAQDHVSVGVLADLGRTELSGLLGVGIGSAAGETDQPE
ncbi:helix-turn-helix domain-containing protein [Streptomyces sp. DSM 15324]|uniref:helix-turn-helix domain-containing protein n=1 Tax=Streptomyces sp. DSM 15324 TaxID=1739111 RepID=UPI001F374E01|nr:helix-turn-helix domain-containing protein [Streptomyces sp. DSM 15324]